MVSCLFPGAVSFYSSSRRPLRTASHRRVASFLRASLIRIRWRDARSLSKENLFHSLINNVLNFSFQGLVTLSILRFCARCRVLYDMIAVIVLVEYRFLEMNIASIFLIIVKAIWIAARRSFSSTVHVFRAAENERVKLFVRCYSRMETLHLDGAFPCSFRIVRSLVTFCRHR